MGTRLLVDRDPAFTFAQTNPSKAQVFRELLKNATEAGATSVEFVGVTVAGTAKMACVDNGCGIGRDEMVDLMDLHSSKKQLGVHDNHGSGLKVAALPHHPYGVEVISWVKGDTVAHRLVLRLDAEGRPAVAQLRNGDYVEPVPFTRLPMAFRSTAKRKVTTLRRLPRTGSGTIVVLHGEGPAHDTAFGPDGKTGSTKGLTRYLNERFPRLRSDLQVKTIERSASTTATHSQWRMRTVR